MVETLEHIESRVARFADVVHEGDLEGFLNEHERKRAERKQKLMLNGPQLNGQGIAQNDVDQLFD